jgi:SulP family sulfate permease
LFKGYEIIVIVKFNDGLFVGDWGFDWQSAVFLATMLHFVIARTEACPNLRTVMSLPHSSLPDEGRIAVVLRSPTLFIRETLAGVITALALIPEVISFSVVAGVDPKVSLIASVVLCLALSVLGGRPAMVTAAAGSVALVIGPMVHQHGVQYILPAVIMAG